MRAFAVRLLLYALFLTAFGLCFSNWLHLQDELSADTRPSNPAPREPLIVGASVLLRVQREGGLVLDLRAGEPKFPSTTRVSTADAQQAISTPSRRPLVLIGEEEIVGRLAPSTIERPLYIVPPRMLEYSAVPGVPQITAHELNARLAQFQILDVSEVDEWEYAHLPNSRRVSFMSLHGGDRSLLVRSRPVVVM